MGQPQISGIYNQNLSYGRLPSFGAYKQDREIEKTLEFANFIQLVDDGLLINQCMTQQTFLTNNILQDYRRMNHRNLQSEFKAQKFFYELESLREDVRFRSTQVIKQQNLSFTQEISEIKIDKSLKLQAEEEEEEEDFTDIEDCSDIKDEQPPCFKSEPQSHSQRSLQERIVIKKNQSQSQSEDSRGQLWKFDQEDQEYIDQVKSDVLVLKQRIEKDISPSYKTMYTKNYQQHISEQSSQSSSNNNFNPPWKLSHQSSEQSIGNTKQNSNKNSNTNNNTPTTSTQPVKININLSNLMKRQKQ